MSESMAMASSDVRSHHIECLDRFSQANTNAFRAGLLLSSLVVIGLWSHLPHAGLLTWLFATWTAQTGHEAFSRYYRRHRGHGADVYRRWLRGFWLGAVVVGACWSLPFFLFEAVNQDVVLLLVFVIAGVTAYGGVARANVLSVALVFEFAVVLPMCTWLFLQDTAIYRIMAAAALLYLLMFAPLLRKMNQMVTRTQLLDVENHRLSDEQKSYHERLRRGEEEYRTLAANLPAAVIRYDQEQRRRYINPAAQKMLHGNIPQMLGLLPGEGGVPTTPEMIEHYRGRMAEVLATGKTLEFEFVLDGLPEGRHEHYYVRMAPEHGNDGKVTGALAIWFDITERKYIEEELRLKEWVLDHAHDGVYLVDEQARFVYANDGACRALGYSREELLDMGMQDIDPAYSAEDANAVRSKELTDGPIAFETQHRRRDGSLFPVEIQASELAYQGKQLGLTMARDISERKQAEAALQGRGDLLHAVIESSPEIIVFALDASYRYLSFNDKHRQVMRAIWGKEIAVGMSMLDVIGSHPDREEAKRGFDRALSGESFVDENAYGDEALSREYWQTFWSPIRASSGEVTGLTCFVLNVSEHRRAEESLRRSERLMRAVIDASPDWIFVKDRNHRYRLVNKSYADALRIPPEDFIGKDGLELGFPEEQVKGDPAKGIRGFWADDLLVLERNKAQIYPDHFVTVDGQVRAFYTIKVPLCDDEGTPWGVLAFARDITERKQVETLLQERYERIVELNAHLEKNACTLEEQATELEASKEQLILTEAWYRGILQSAPDGMVVVDERGVIRLVNEQLCRIFGYEEGELLGQTIEVLVPFGMRDAHKASRAGFIASGFQERPMADASGRRKDGGEFFVDVSLARLPEIDGAVGTICAAIRDVTERKCMEQALAKREQEFRTLVENSVDTVARYGKDLRRLYVNPAFAALVEGGADRLLGRTPSECPGGANAAKYEKKLAEVLAEGRGLEFELSWPDGSGQQICSLISLTPEFDAQGKVASVLAVGRDITELNAFRQRIHQMAFYDSLTSLPNRALFNDRLRQMITDAEWHGQQAGLMMIDMDRFKAVNDTLGHPAGDELLRETAARLSTCVRAYDTVARLGGDEFAILLPEIRVGDDLGRIAGKILAVFERPFLLEGKEVFVSCSIGIALYPCDSLEADDLFKYADSAMYSAKRSGRNNFRFYSRDLTESAHELLVLESDLRRAIGREELELYYQPKVSLGDGALAGSEALLRWNHPERGMVLPDVFIGIAEDSGLIVEIGEWVLREACRTACRWNGEGKPLHKVAINLSARQFQWGDLDGTVRRALQESGCRAEWIELEITESLLLDEAGGVLDVLNGFRAMGISIAIDDFGTGYSALSYLARFPIETLKIDRSFISCITTDEYRAELVKAILSIARCLGQLVVAEGVETQEQAAFLLAHGCQLAQGYLYGKPMPVDAFSASSHDSSTARQS